MTRARRLGKGGNGINVRAALMDTETSWRKRDGEMVTYRADKGPSPRGGRTAERETGDTATLIREILHILRLVVRSGDGTSGSALPPSFAYTSRTANNLTHTYGRIPTYRIKSPPLPVPGPLL